jgi:hypothetical protein
MTMTEEYRCCCGIHFFVSSRYNINEANCWWRVYQNWGTIEPSPNVWWLSTLPTQPGTSPPLQIKLIGCYDNPCLCSLTFFLLNWYHIWSQIVTKCVVHAHKWFDWYKEKGKYITCFINYAVQYKHLYKLVEGGQMTFSHAGSVNVQLQTICFHWLLVWFCVLNNILLSGKLSVPITNMARFHENIIFTNKSFVSWDTTDTWRYRYLPIAPADSSLYKTIDFANAHESISHAVSHVFINGFRLSPRTIQV